MSSAAQDPVAEERYPGQWLGLPESGRGSLASWRARVAALLLDWVVCMALAVLFFGTAVLTGSGWRSFMTLTLFVLETTILVPLFGGSLGQLICKITVVRVDFQQIGFGRSLLRAVLVGLAVPALIVGANRRGLQDLAANTVVVNKR